MTETKFGVDQFNSPSPLWYRRLSNALIIFVLPATASLLSAWGGIPENTLNHLLLIISYVPALIKGIGTLLGNGQVYVPSNKRMDLMKEEEKQNPNNKN